MTSYKNKLQEYCQKHNQPFPEYKAVQLKNGHEPIWEVKLYFNSKTYTRQNQNKKQAELAIAEEAYKDTKHKKKVNYQDISKIDSWFTNQTNYNDPLIIKTINEKNTIIKCNEPIIVEKVIESPYRVNDIKYIPNKLAITEKVKKNTKSQKVKHIWEINFSKYDSILLMDGDNVDISEIEDNILILIFVAKNTTRHKVFKLQNNENIYVFISDSVGKDAADHLLTFNAGILHHLLFDKDMNYYVFTKDHFGELLEKFMPNCKYICSINEIYK